MPLLLACVSHKCTRQVNKGMSSVLGKQQLCFEDKIAVVQHAWLFHTYGMCSIFLPLCNWETH